MVKKIIYLFAILSLFFGKILFANQSLQTIITNANPGSKIELPKGIFKGPIYIDKPIILMGQGKDSIIKNDGNDTILTIKSPYVTIKNITFKDSGHQRFKLDAGIKIKNSSHIVIKNCNFNKTLFGIILSDSFKSKIIGNTFISYSDKVVDNRGDGIRLWNSHNNEIIGNKLQESRDISLNRSNHNILKNNRVEKSRYGILINMSKDINATNNYISSNYVGIMIKGGKNIYLQNNKITKTHLCTGTGIMIKGGKRIHISHNYLSGHAQAIYIISSVSENGMRRYIAYNTISNNNVAFRFYMVIKNNTIQNNNIIGNLEDVAKDVRGGHPYKNDIKFNFWDRYIGFDKNHDNISDIPYQILTYQDKLWQFAHHAKFFYSTPLLSIIDFIERLAPFSKPVLLFEDTKPRIEPAIQTGSTLK